MRRKHLTVMPASHYVPTKPQEQNMTFQNLVARMVDVIFGYDFFVAYTWADGSKYGDSLYEKLKAQGFTVFLDKEEYARGDNWSLFGRRALRKTRQFILIATPHVHHGVRGSGAPMQVAVYMCY
jgi:hypothetical protein